MRTLSYWMAIFFVFLIPFEKSITFGSRNGPTLAMFVGLGVAGMWAATVLLTDRFRMPQPFHLLVGLFLLWNAASILWSIDVSLSVLRMQTYVQLAGMVLVLWDMLTTVTAVRAALQAYVLGAWISVGSTIYNFIQGVTAHEYIARYTASGFNENEVSLVLALGIPMAWYLATLRAPASHGGTLLRLLNYAYAPACLFAVLLTASRGGLLCTLPAFLYVLAGFGRLRRLQRFVLFVVLVVALYWVQSLVPETSYERLTEADEVLSSGELNGRGEVWQLGYEVFRRNPIFGVGTGAFQAATELGRAAHNAYLSVLVETGGVGLGLFLGLLAVAIQQSLRQPRAEAWLWLTVLAIWALGVLPLSLEYRKPTWLVLSLPVLGAHARTVARAGLAAARLPASQPQPALDARPQ